RFVRPGIERDDLVQEGYLGLFAAVAAWEGGGSFKSYANIRILEFVRKAATQDVYIGGPEVVSLDDTMDDGGTRHDVVAGESLDVEAALGEAEQAAVIREAITKLPTADRSLLDAWAN